MSPAARRKLSLLALAWPIFVEQGLHVLVGTVDVLMVSRVSDDAVAALGQSGQVVYLSIVVFSFIAIGAGVVVTHHLGADDRAGADRIASTAIAVNTWIGLVVSLLVVAFSLPMLRVMQLPARLVPLAMQFLPLMGGTLFLEAQNLGIFVVFVLTTPSVSGRCSSSYEGASSLPPWVLRACLLASCSRSGATAHATSRSTTAEPTSANGVSPRPDEPAGESRASASF